MLFRNLERNYRASVWAFDGVFSKSHCFFFRKESSCGWMLEPGSGDTKPQPVWVINE